MKKLLSTLSRPTPSIALSVIEDSSTSYVPRTIKNAEYSDFTIAIAADYGTSGEKLTREAAGDRYIRIPAHLTPEQAVEVLIAKMGHFPRPVLNIAGNGIYTLCKHGYTQLSMNRHLYEILRGLSKAHQLKGVRSGGQTGVDFAGAVAGYALSIPTTVLMPKGFRQRNVYSIDIENSPEDIVQQIKNAATYILHGPY